MTLAKIFDAFRKNYQHIEINNQNIDFTQAFHNTKNKPPHKYTQSVTSTVLGYVVKAATFTTKYKQVNGKTVIDNNRLVITPWTDEQKVIACLCNNKMRNTSFHEIYDARDALETIPHIQGFTLEHINNILSIIEQKDQTFDPEKDTAFLFAGKRKEVLPKLKLNRLWLSATAYQGERSLYIHTPEEHGLMKKVFNPGFLFGNYKHIKKHSYMIGRKNTDENANPLYVEESTIFLAMKAMQFLEYEINEKRASIEYLQQKIQEEFEVK